jgi:hypothetical protein
VWPYGILPKFPKPIFIVSSIFLILIKMKILYIDIDLLINWDFRSLGERTSKSQFMPSRVKNNKKNDIVIVFEKFINSIFFLKINNNFYLIFY